MSKKMTHRQRFLAAAHREPHDHVPVIGPWMYSGLQHDLMDFNYTFEEVQHDPIKMFRIAQRQHTIYGFDAMTMPLDMRIEGLAYGSKVGYTLPTSKGFRQGINCEWVINKEKDLAKLKVINPKDVPYMVMSLEVIARLRETFPDVALIGAVNGIVQTHTDVVNDVEKFPGDPNGHYQTYFLNMTNNPKFIHQVNEILVEGSIAWGKALIEAGCDAIMSLEWGGMLGIPSEQYQEFFLEDNKKIREGIGAPYIFNDCNIGPYMDAVVNSGIDVVQIPANVDLKETGEKYGDKVCLVGNLALHNAGDLLWSGKFEEVLAKARELLEVGKTLPGYMLASECEVHYDIPRANIWAMTEAAREYGTRS